MAKKVGELIKKARTDAGLTQEQLAKEVRRVRIGLEEMLDRRPVRRGEGAIIG